MDSACRKDPTPACVCTNEPLQEQVTLCIKANCTVKEALAAKNLTNTECGVLPRNRAAGFPIASIVLAVLSCGMVAVRLGFKIFVTRSMAPDDYAVAVLVAFAIPSIVIIHVGMTPNGVGKDMWALTAEEITNFLLFFYIMAVLYFLQVMLVKLCILLFYLRIFPSQGVRRLLWATLVFNVTWGVLYFFVAVFQCAPVSHFWTHWDGEHKGKCLNSNAIAWSNAIISIVLDFWMLGIPLAQIRSINLNWKKKVGVVLMFMVGTFVTVVSIIRLQSLVVFASSENASWDNFPVSLWSTVEINAGIMCTCMPTLRLILVRLFPALGGTGPGSSYANAKSGAGRYYGRCSAAFPGAGTGGGKSGTGSRSKTLSAHRVSHFSGAGAGASASARRSHHKRATLGSTSWATTSCHGGDCADDGVTVVATSTASADSVAGAAKLPPSPSSLSPSSSKSPAPKSAGDSGGLGGIIRQQTFAVRYEDEEAPAQDDSSDEESLVEMHGIDRPCRPGTGKGW
ncbi:hypothetical protein VTH82DRAFT_7854 [Thermothelomyces myriococcoides]